MPGEDEFAGAVPERIIKLAVETALFPEVLTVGVFANKTEQGAVALLPLLVRTKIRSDAESEFATENSLPFLASPAISFPYGRVPDEPLVIFFKVTRVS